MKTHFYFFVVLSVYLQNGFAQDQIFFNSNQSLISLNPSFAGSNGGIRNQSSYRNNLNPWARGNQSYYNATDFYIKSLKAGLAFSAFFENTFDIVKKMQLQFAYAQHFSFMKGKLNISPSLQASYNKTAYDYNGVSFGDLLSGKTHFISPSPLYDTKGSTQFFSLNAGLLINYKHFYLGTTILDMSHNDSQYSGRTQPSLKTIVHCSYNANVSKNVAIYLMAAFGSNPEIFRQQFEIKTLLFKQFIVGIGNRYQDYTFGTLGYKNNYFTATVCYAPSFSALTYKHRGPIEFALSYNLRNKEQRKTLTDFERW